MSQLYDLFILFSKYVRTWPIGLVLEPVHHHSASSKFTNIPSRSRRLGHIVPVYNIGIVCTARISYELWA